MWLQAGGAALCLSLASTAGGAVAGGLNCYFGCMGGFSEWGLSLDCHFLSGVRANASLHMHIIAASIAAAAAAQRRWLCLAMARPYCAPALFRQRVALLHCVVVETTLTRRDGRHT
jgi:hypothetical protein